MPVHAHFFRRAILTGKVGQTDLVLVCDQGSLVGLCLQYYKSLCAAVTICATPVDPNIVFLTFWPLWRRKAGQSEQTAFDQPAELKIEVQDAYNSKIIAFAYMLSDDAVGYIVS